MRSSPRALTQVRMQRELVLVLDNIRSLHNVGSMFRSADGFGVKKIILCGITGTPEQSGVQKVALGAEKSVPWERAFTTRTVVERPQGRRFFRHRPGALQGRAADREVPSAREGRAGRR